MTCNNIKYVLSSGESLRSYCKTNNVKYDTVIKRMKKKCMTIEQALSIDKMCKSYLLCSDGTPLIKKVTDINKYRACLWRIAVYGVSVDDSLKPVDKSKARSKHFFNGRTLKEICGKDNSLYRRTLYRLRKGYSIQHSLYGNKWDLIYG